MSSIFLSNAPADPDLHDGNIPCFVHRGRHNEHSESSLMAALKKYSEFGQFILLLLNFSNHRTHC